MLKMTTGIFRRTLSAMKASETRPSNRGLAVKAALRLALLIGLAYGGSLNAIWTFDDFPNIVHNPRVRIDDLLPETLRQTIYAPQTPDDSGPPQINRPLAYLSFAVNWYFGHDSPAGYRLVNLAIHLATAFLLFLVVRELLAAAKFRDRHAGSEPQIAFLAAALWALNPVQTQAVVYIVQRMASMACLFYLLAIYGYVRARQAGSRAGNTGFGLLAVAGYAAAVGSKENAVVLPAALVLLEFSFYRDFEQPRVRWCFGGVLALGLLILLTAAGWVAYRGGHESVFSYSGRLFSPWERLMTQPRVVLFYLSQLFYPIPSRLSITHDLEISRSLIEPWSTAPALLAVLALMVFALLRVRRQPLASFGILFFFLNHAVESSVIGLELVFEHRNYLPSLFLFVPVAAGLHGLVSRYREKQSGFRHVIAAFIVLLLGGLCAGTHIRTLAWADARTFWEDAAAKAPGSMRPLHNLAFEYYEKKGRREEAFQLYQKSLSLDDQNRKGLGVAHTNIANYYYRKGDLEKAKEHLEKAISAAPDIDHIHYFQTVVLRRTGELERAAAAVTPLLQKHPDSFRYNLIMAQILLESGRPGDAVIRLQVCLAQSPESAEVHALLGVALNLLGDYPRAAHFLREALQRHSGDRLSLIWMIDTELKASDLDAAANYTLQFLKGIPDDRIEESVDAALGPGRLPESSSAMLKSWVLRQSRLVGFGR